MSEIIFIFRGHEVPIQCSPGEKMKFIMERLCMKLNIAKNDIYGLHNGKFLNEEINESQLKKNENGKKFVLVYQISDTVVNNKIIKTSNEIICPTCKENCLLEIKGYQIILFGCKHGHKNNISIKEFNETQKVIISDIICNICKERNKGNTINNEFYKCLNCKINICPLCRLIHDNNHNIINYDIINFICNEHYEPFTSFCSECKINTCVSCEINHIDHSILSYGRMMRNKKEIIEKGNILRKNIDELKNIIQEIIKKLNIVVDNIEAYYKIKKRIIDNINNKFRNYEMLFNINNISNNNINDDIEKIINENDINIQFNNIMKIYISMNKKIELNNDKENKINIKDEINDINKSKNEILIKYKIGKEDKEINIFGEDFIKNNKKICKYIYEDKEYELTPKI